MSTYASDIDNALQVVARQAENGLNLKDLEESTTFEALDALSKTGMANFIVTRFASGRYRFRWIASPHIMPAGEKRLKEIRGE
ncbi:hypothetical protein RDI61_01640 [Pseudomonas plecoglossicida]|uniref:hypothetical protein n=1 Tax=Pseudomonas TaxID=286 RepID=UPI00240FFF5D|nr:MULTISPECIES: hypothetical protein [Pseudomonas]MDN5518997.1 hypothetical protein [Pseudomonas sp.]MDN5530930.1 hypothetical protein [Pseudomonas sp.]MDQ7962754.1 hypothetical protein [Pseudomonas plecoglossicida]WFG05248.1 hypothetical protein P3X84_11670 [Pseudomonas putida]